MISWPLLGLAALAGALFITVTAAGPFLLGRARRRNPPRSRP